MLWQPEKPVGCCGIQSVFPVLLCREIKIVLLHGRENAQISLYTMVVVVAYVVLDHIDQLFLAGETLAVIALALQDAPEAFHRSVVDALGYTGHTLFHTGVLQFLMERAVRVLKASITVKQRMRVGIRSNGFVKGLENQRIIVMLAYNIRHDTPVEKVKNGAEIDLVHFNSFIPFEFCDICEPFFIWLISVKIAVKKIFGYILWILCLTSAAVVTVFDGGFDALDAAEAKDAFVIHMDMLVMPKVIIDAAVTLVRVLHVDLLNLFGYLFVLQRSSALLAGCPTVVRRS